MSLIHCASQDSGFGLLRGILAGEPSPQKWLELLGLFQRWGPDHRELALSYALEHLQQSWPARLRRFPLEQPELWSDGLELPWLGLCLSIDLPDHTHLRPWLLEAVEALPWENHSSDESNLRSWARMRRVLEEGDVRFVAELTALEPQDLLRLKSAGRSLLRATWAVLQEVGLELGMYKHIPHGLTRALLLLAQRHRPDFDALLQRSRVAWVEQHYLGPGFQELFAGQLERFNGISLLRLLNLWPEGERRQLAIVRAAEILASHSDAPDPFRHWGDYLTQIFAQHDERGYEGLEGAYGVLEELKKQYARCKEEGRYP